LAFREGLESGVKPKFYWLRRIQKPLADKVFLLLFLQKKKRLLPGRIASLPIHRHDAAPVPGAPTMRRLALTLPLLAPLLALSQLLGVFTFTFMGSAGSIISVTLLSGCPLVSKVEPLPP
jgi:hypothetical protein